MKNKYIADDRDCTPEYFEKIKNMTEEEFELHIKKLKEQEAACDSEE